jgi:hypothetical protein
MGTIMPFFGIGRYGQKRGGRHFVGQKRSATRRLDHALRVGEGDRVGNSTSGSNRASGPSRLSCEDRKRQTGRDPEGPRSTLGPTALKVGSPHTRSLEESETGQHKGRRGVAHDPALLDEALDRPWIREPAFQSRAGPASRMTVTSPPARALERCGDLAHPTHV